MDSDNVASRGPIEEACNRMADLAGYEASWQPDTEFGKDAAAVYREISDEMRKRAATARNVGEDDLFATAVNYPDYAAALTASRLFRNAEVSSRPEEPRRRRVPLTYVAVGVAAATLVARRRRQRRKTRG